MRRRGFTLIELMIVIAIISLIAAIAIPNLIESRKRANETAAIAGLKAIQTAEALCREKYEDPAVGSLSYTYVRSAAANGLYDQGLLTGFTADTSSPVAASFLTRQGYRYFGRPSAVVQDRPFLWVAIAWPMLTGTTGDRRFMTNHTGVVFYHPDWVAGTPFNYTNLGVSYITCDVDPANSPPDGQPYKPVGR